MCCSEAQKMGRIQTRLSTEDDNLETKKDHQNDQNTDSKEQLLRLEDGESDFEECGIETNWNKITIAGLIWFLSAVENTVVGMSEWPYMAEVDKEATTSFFGFVTSSAGTGHAIFSLLFTYWGYKSKGAKTPLLIGRLIALIASILYLCVEILPEKRRYLMLICYFLFGVGYSSTTVLRSYIAEVSHPKDRSRAYAVSTVAHLTAIVLGPAVQLVFAPLKYPGFEIWAGKIRFHIFSAPIWFALLTNIFCVILIKCFFKEPEHKRVETVSKKTDSADIVTRILQVVRSTDVSWSLVFLCWFQKMISTMAIVTITTTAAPMVMVSFGWDGQTTVTAISIAQGTVGILSILVSCAYVFGNIGQYISARSSYILSLVIFLMLYLLTYPWSIVSSPIATFNETTRTGCHPLDYNWCDNQATTPWIWFPVVVFVMGVGIPLAIISIDTIYSKVLGDIDQKIMQGLLSLMEDIFVVIGPIYSAEMFTSSGQSWLWIINGAITLGAMLIWMGSYKKLAPYK